MLCLFETLEGALGFGEEIYKYLPPIRNKPEIFGEQMVRNEQDEPVDEEPLLLINALTLSIDRLLPLAREYGGEAIPAHANKSTTSIMSSLGFIPPDYGFACIELNPPDERFAFQGRRISDSDAHYLEQIHEPEFFLELPEKSPRIERRGLWWTISRDDKALERNDIYGEDRQLSGGSRQAHRGDVHLPDRRRCDHL